MDKLKVMIPEKEIREIVDKLAQDISRDYADKRLLLLCVLKGSVVFTSDLMRRLTVPCEIDFLQTASYGDKTAGGEVRVQLDTKLDLSDYDVLVVEDILDSGRTLSKLGKMLAARGPKSLELCALLDKPSRRETDVQAKYIGKAIPDAFVVGYGLDYAQKYRELPYLAELSFD
ncbi:MAG: hypoxanthine phosphoribosyltransferase [Oscillospiraceae bacterium]|nr:hypoxanthine phosphoribosyltransferase [Oscillospiraceae bacterium]